MIRDDELAIAARQRRMAIPAIFEWYDNFEVGLLHPLVPGSDVRNNDLQVDAAPIWPLKRRGTKPPPRTPRFLEHQVSRSDCKVGECLLGALREDLKPKYVAINAQRCGQVRYVKLRNESGCFDHRRTLTRAANGTDCYMWRSSKRRQA